MENSYNFRAILDRIEPGVETDKALIRAKAKEVMLALIAQVAEDTLKYQADGTPIEKIPDKLRGDYSGKI
jgi:hypothetical protein